MGWNHQVDSIIKDLLWSFPKYPSTFPIVCLHLSGQGKVTQFFGMEGERAPKRLGFEAVGRSLSAICWPFSCIALYQSPWATYIYIRMYLIYDYNYNPQIITIIADMFSYTSICLAMMDRTNIWYIFMIYIYTYIFMKWRFYDELIVLYKTFKKTPFMPYNLLSKLCPLAWSTAWICDSNSNPS